VDASVVQVVRRHGAVPMAGWAPFEGRRQSRRAAWAAVAPREVGQRA